MTRINLVPPSLLSGKHLLAEHREIKRIPNHVAKYGLQCILNTPEEFTLGTGHFRFFLPLAKFTLDRYITIYKECKKRGFNVTFYGLSWDVYKGTPYEKKTWKPSLKDVFLSADRLLEKDPAFYKVINLHKAIRKTHKF